MLSLPCGLSDVEGRAAINAAIKAGARQVIVIEAPVAAALGAGCDVSIARGLMVLDIGGAKSEMAAISLCNSVVSKKINTSGNSFLKDIKEFMLKRHNLEIGTKTARLIKDELCLLSPFTEKNLDVFGVDSSTHMPRKVRIFSRETEGIFDEHIDELASLIRDTLDIVPPELLGDILADGILLVGGATFGTLSEKLSEKSGIKIFPADDIALCTIKGTGIALEHLEELPNIAQSYHNL